MKKIGSLVLSLILSSFVITESMAQVLPPPELQTIKKLSANPWQNPRGFMNCDPVAVYGQEPFTQVIVGLPSVVISGFIGSLAIDNIPETVEVIGGITFWGSFVQYDLPCIPDGPVDFKILFFEYDFEEQFIPAHTVDFTATGQMVMFEDVPVFRYDVIFPEPVDISNNRFFSVVQYFGLIKGPEREDEMPCLFYWLASDQGDLTSTIIGFQFGEITEMYPLPVDLAFCLRYPGTAIPVKNWSLLVALSLMVSIILIRYRFYTKG